MENGEETEIFLLTKGGCQCGAVRYEIIGEPVMSAICHCMTCRRANAAPAVAWCMYKYEQVRFISGEIKKYSATEGVERGFCANCGTQISFQADYIPGLIDITLGSFDDPEVVKPAMHNWYSSHLSWVEFADSLPRHAEFPPEE